MGNHVQSATLVPDNHPFAGAAILDDPERDLLLSSMRSLTAQYRLFVQQLDSIGLALKAGRIEPATARQWLEELGMWEAMPMAGILNEREAQ